MKFKIIMVRQLFPDFGNTDCIESKITLFIESNRADNAAEEAKSQMNATIHDDTWKIERVCQ